MKPALQRLEESLDTIDEPAWCEGKAACDRLVFESRGDSCATDDPDAFVAWLTGAVELVQPIPEVVPNIAASSTIQKPKATAVVRRKKTP